MTLVTYTLYAESRLIKTLELRARSAITFVIIAMVISSPVFMLGPDQAWAATATDNTNKVDSSYHSTPHIVDSALSSTSSPVSTPTAIATPTPQDGDFTTQGALGLTRATQTSNIVDSKTYYDIIFRTATAGTIKTVEMDFPPGTYVGAASLVEATGIGPGKIAASGTTATGMKITYTVTNAVNVPVFTNIRIQIANINNPQEPSASYIVTITTRDATSTIIDGPTSTNAYNVEQISTGQIESGALSIDTNRRLGSSENLAPGESDTVIAECLPGETLTGGGYMSVYPVLNFYHNGKPFADNNEQHRWMVSAVHDGIGPPLVNFLAMALCAPAMP